LPKTVAKIEKNMIGSRNVIACATRSRRRFTHAIRTSVQIIPATPGP
jgi:hypothetical protein